VARSALGSPINEDNSTGEHPEIFPMRPRLPAKEESADAVPGACYIATADDFSFVKLFNGPVVADDAPYRAYRGHASHVTCVRFSNDDRRLFSVGGVDRCVFQWRTVGICREDHAVDAYILRAVEEASFRKYQVQL
jgi:WD40 repeat protein